MLLKSKKIPNHVLLLRDLEIPSVIVECGFLSNKNEAELLLSDEYQNKIAWGIYIGLMNFFTE